MNISKKSEEDITKKTKHFYTDYPFPNYDISTQESFKQYCLKHTWYLRTIPLAYIKESKNKTLLDCGGGTGENSCMFASLGFDVTGFDISPSSVRKAKQNAKNLDLKISYFEADILNLSLNEKFDIVFCMGVIQHTQDPVRAFKKISKYIKPGGILVIGTYNLYGSLMGRIFQREKLRLFFGNKVKEKIKYLMKKDRNLASLPNARELILDGTDNPKESFFTIGKILQMFKDEGLKPCLASPPIIIKDYFRNNKISNTYSSRLDRFFVQLVWTLAKKDFFTISGIKSI